MKGADLHHALGIVRQLSWTLYKVAAIVDGLRAAPSDPPAAAMYPESIDEGPFPAPPRTLQRLEFKAEIKYMAKGHKALRTPEIPRYSEMARYVFNRTDWDGERFDVYRCRIAYPILPSTTGIRFNLPERPADG